MLYVSVLSIVERLEGNWIGNLAALPTFTQSAVSCLVSSSSRLLSGFAEIIRGVYTGRGF